MFTFAKTPVKKKTKRQRSEPKKKDASVASAKRFCAASTTIDRAALLALLPEHGVTMDRVMQICKHSANTMHVFSETKDELTLIAYFLVMFGFQTQELHADADALIKINALVWVVWNRCSSTDRYAFLCAIHNVLCERPKTQASDFLLAIQQIYTEHYAGELLGRHNLCETDTIALITSHALINNDVETVRFMLQHMPRPYLDTLIASCNTVTIRNAPFCVFVESTCNDEMFALLLSCRIHSNDYMYELAIHDFKHLAALTRLTQENMLTQFSVARFKSWNKICDINKRSAFFRAAAQNFDTHFSSEAYVINIAFLRFFFSLIEPHFFFSLYGEQTLQQMFFFSNEAWAVIKAEVPEKELLEMMKKPQYLEHFYRDFPFHQKLLTTHYTPQRLRNLIVKENLIDAYARRNELAGVKWAWSVLTADAKRKFWNSNAALILTLTLLSNNNNTSLEMFKTTYGNGYIDKNKKTPFQTFFIAKAVQKRINHTTGTLPSFILIQNKCNNNADLYHGILFYLLFDIVTQDRTHYNYFYENTIDFFLSNVDALLDAKPTPNTVQVSTLYLLTLFCASLHKAELDAQKTRILASISKIVAANPAHFVVPVTINYEASDTTITKNFAPNELMRRAIEHNHFCIMFALLQFPAIAAATDAANYYTIRNALKPVIQDNESAIRELNSYEKNIYAAVMARYGPDVDTLTIPNIFYIMRETIRSAFEATYTFPFDYDGSTPRATYLANPLHGAWRFLAVTNPFIKRSLTYITSARGANYYGLERTICAYYLAAIDESEPCINGFSTHTERALFFFTELAGMNRTHNWDNIVPNPDGTTREADDGDLDKPTCFSGMLRRLTVSVPGNAISNAIPTEQNIAEVTRDLLRPIFEEKKKTLNMSTFTRIAVDLEPLDEQAYNELAAANLTDDEQCTLFQTLLKTTFCSMKDIIALKAQMEPRPGVVCTENLHVITFFQFVQ